MANRHRYPRDHVIDSDAPEPGPQPDPLLPTTSRVSAVREWLVAIVIILIVTAVFYGLNKGAPETSETVSTQTTENAPPPSPPARTTGQAPEANQAPQANQPPQASQAPNTGRPDTPSPSGQGTR